MNEQPNQIDKLTSLKYDPNFIPPPQSEILTINGKLVGTLGNFVIVTGGVKVGKSSILAGLVASSFDLFDVYKMKITLPPGRKNIAYFDTEMAQYDFYRQMNRIKQQSNVERLPDYFHAYNMRECEPNEIIKLIDFHFQQIDTPVIIIDGLLDLLFDFLDAVESKRLITILKKWTKKYNTLIIAVLHTGKTTNGNTLGHIGSATDRYCQSTIEIVKSKEQNLLSIESKFLRSDAPFEPVMLYNNKGVLHITDNEIIDDDVITANKILNNQNNYDETIQNMMEMLGCTKATAKKKFKGWIDKKIIMKQGDVYVKFNPFKK
jgi:archaellum biogenesis ATPase FlaH